MSSFNPNNQATGGNSINPDEPNYAEEWSLFKAVQDVDMNGFSILNTTFDLSDQNLEIDNLKVDGNYTSTGNITISGDIECDDLRVFGEQITDPSGNLRRQGIQLGGGVPIQHPQYDGFYKMGLFQRDISQNALYPEAPNVENKGQGATGLQVYDLNNEYSNPEANNAGSISFGNRNSFGSQVVQYGKIAGLRTGNFSGGLVMKTMRAGTGFLYPALSINQSQMIRLGRIPYNDAGDVLGGVETPLVIKASNGGNVVGQHIDLYDNAYAIGIQASTLYHRTAVNTAFFIGGDFSPSALDPSGGTLAGYFNANGLNMNSNYIESLADPVNPQDAATKAYVDSLAPSAPFLQQYSIANSGNLDLYPIPYEEARQTIDISGLTQGLGQIRIPMNEWRASPVQKIEIFLRNITPPAGSAGSIFIQTFSNDTFSANEDSMMDIFPSSTSNLASLVTLGVNQEANAHATLYKIEKDGNVQIAVDRQV